MPGPKIHIGTSGWLYKHWIGRFYPEKSQICFNGFTTLPENWRRQDMIRFEKFLEPFQEKDDPSDPKYLLFPIPYEQLAVNPYLEQNPGY